MKVWLPYTRGGSGSDVFTRILAAGLRGRGIETVEQPFAHDLQYAPWLLRGAKAPAGTDLTLSNSWNGFAFKRPGIRLVTVEHLFVLDPALRPYRSLPQAIFHQTLVGRFERASQRASDVQVAVSQYTADAHHRALGDPKPTVILNGIDTEFFTPSMAGKPPAGDRPFRLLFVGNLTRRKGIDMIAPILQALGDGYELHYAVGLRTADALANLPNAHALGRLNHEQVREAYRSADVLLFPTRLEGLPLVAMEAMACGTPVIASKASSLPEIIEPEVDGMLCDADAPAEFVAAIRTLRNDLQRLAHMALAARRKTLTRFNLARMVGEYVDLFAELLPETQRSDVPVVH